jgi:hypothetical protein
MFKMFLRRMMEVTSWIKQIALSASPGNLNLYEVSHINKFSEVLMVSECFSVFCFVLFVREKRMLVFFKIPSASCTDRDEYSDQ